MHTTIEEKIQAITATPKAPEVRDATALELGQVAHQGDIYCHRVPDDWPRGARLGTRQVAVGNTVGARHVVTGDVEVYAGVALPRSFRPPKWLRGADPKPIFLGPVVVARAGAVLTHPEHAHHALCGTYQVTYQADTRARARMQD